MSKLMLIDAAHPEETRVTVVADGQIEDFDFEARDKRQLRGNIYLAKVTRVEPSLQAAFVEYGGNRHGFLAFSEIHPDYYQIPQEDREALLAEEMASSRDSDDDDDDHGVDDDDSEAAASSDDDDSTSDDSDADTPKSKPRRQRPTRRYKIQDVIKRRQVLLIQVVKEERGNKGAAVTTYLSLAGRYGVLMPNTARGGGISRKIANAVDRKRLKKIMSEFSVPEGMGLIIRTAGAKRTKSEISRDYDYLIRLWSTIREQTLDSMAPCLIHEEGDLVLRAIRDLFDRDVDNIIVEGKEAYTQAKNVISMLMPDHANKVIEHNHKAPLFISHGVEAQLDNIFSPVVQLPSGGYLVINQTEALVAVDVNSGKATRERNIEATAVKTNLEAAAEVCRQMRLRDLAGLVVIDFIDMEETKNNRAVEKKMKDCLSIDRARVQTGRISQFGLFEISRQRRRAGVLELSSEPCKACQGTGRNRSIESAALQLLRAIEERGADERVDSVTAKAPSEVALYILNHKRDSITNMEASTGADILISADDEMMPGDFAIEATSEGNIVAYKPIVPVDATPKKRRPHRHEEVEDEEDTSKDSSNDGDDDSDDPDSDENARRRRRGRRGGRRRRGSENGSEETADGLEVIDGDAEDDKPSTDTSDNASRRSSRRRRPRRRTPDVAVDGGEMLDAIASAPFLAIETPEEEEESSPAEAEQSASTDGESNNEGGRSRNGKRRRRKRKNNNAAQADNNGTENSESQANVDAEAPEQVVADASDSTENADTSSQNEPEKPAKTVEKEADVVAQAPQADVVETPTDAPEATKAPDVDVPEQPAPAPAPTPEPAKAEIKPVAPVAIETAAEEDLHSIHVETPVLEKKEAPKKRRIGWWNRK
ncbi:Rne/Rng family ribonuclease [Hirschia litorea]|uniref:Ribonuclease E n=1 Tax=Hirschia litorea TaxID=1199156 RepID=A0ABW2II25_9PROT